MADLSDVVGVPLKCKGEYDASLAAPPPDATPGDLYKVIVAGTILGVDYAIGDMFIYVLDGTLARISGGITGTHINLQVGTAYAVQGHDAESMVVRDNALANTTTLPSNATEAIPPGTAVNFMQLGVGATTIDIETDTLLVEASFTTTLFGQNAVATALKIDTTTWVLFGNLGVV